MAFSWSFKLGLWCFCPFLLSCFPYFNFGPGWSVFIILCFCVFVTDLFSYP